MGIKTRQSPFDYVGVKGYVPLTREQERSVFEQRDASRVIQGWVENQQRCGKGSEWVTCLISQIGRDEKAFYDNLRAKFIANGVSLAMHQSLKYSRLHYRTESPGDLLPLAEIELVRAFDRFDFSRGVRFSTFYCAFVKKAFCSSFHKRRIHATDSLSGSHSLYNNEPTSSDSLYCSLTAPRFSGDETMFKEYDSARVSALVGHALNGLSSRERLVLESRFGLNGSGSGEGECLTLKETSARIGCTSRERARTIESRALERLKREPFARRAARALNLID
ncbi:MAG TPA: sigma factor-like helix-turn-helix DNA-binding protein [Candidatus Nanoarchaeia archaeon]|nr:sigma factor-like helix-turn-helix DNA-binding protein [Candidatus Nanoarchaeia archaeon]